MLVLFVHGGLALVVGAMSPTKTELMQIMGRTQAALEVVSSRLGGALALMRSGRIGLGINRAEEIAAELRALLALGVNS